MPVLRSACLFCLALGPRVLDASRCDGSPVISNSGGHVPFQGGGAVHKRVLREGWRGVTHTSVASFRQRTWNPPWRLASSGRLIDEGGTLLVGASRLAALVLLTSLRDHWRPAHAAPLPRLETLAHAVPALRLHGAGIAKGPVVLPTPPTLSTPALRHSRQLPTTLPALLPCCHGIPVPGCGVIQLTSTRDAGKRSPLWQRSPARRSCWQ